MRDPDGAAREERLGLWSGVGLVVANMVGAGVFLSAGFMAQEMGPLAILFGWVVGALIALMGTVVYGAAARLVPRSGGEYRYLKELVHPALGYLAGWASLLVGFSAPIAVAGGAAGHFAATLGLAIDPKLTGTVLIVLLTAIHASGFALSRRAQDSLVAVKSALVVAFAVVGLAHATDWPAWSPPQPTETPLTTFLGSLFIVAFAFSGWNASV